MGVDSALLEDAPTVAPLGPTNKSDGPLLCVTRGTRFVSVRAANELLPTEAGVAKPQNTLETVVGGDEIVNGVRGVRYDTRLNGKPFQSEVYALQSDGSVLGLATGPNASVALVPPLPIIGSRKLQNAHGVMWTKWRGKLVPRKLASDGLVARPIEAEALCRVVGGASASARTPDTRTFIKTARGTYSTLRVDLVVSLLLPSGSDETTQARTRQTTLWVAPGVGVVQQAYPSGPVPGQNAVWTLKRIDAPVAKTAAATGANAQ